MNVFDLQQLLEGEPITTDVAYSHSVDEHTIEIRWGNPPQWVELEHMGGEDYFIVDCENSIFGCEETITADQLLEALC